MPPVKSKITAKNIQDLANSLNIKPTLTLKTTSHIIINLGFDENKNNDTLNLKIKKELNINIF